MTLITAKPYRKKKDALIDANEEIEEIKKKQTGIIQESQPMQPD